MPQRNRETGSGDELALDGPDAAMTRGRLPDLRGEVVVADADELIDHLAADLVVHAENCVRRFGDFHLALSGGAIFEPLYRRLMYDPNYRRLPWRRTHLWLVEERCVPLDDERSRYRMVRELVGDHADIPAEQFHAIPAESECAVEDYETLLRDTLAWRERGQDRLDYALLTIAADGGTAGIAAGDAARAAAPADPAPAAESGRLHLLRRHPSPDGRAPARVSMTLPFLNGTRFIAVLVLGSERAEAVRRLGGGPATGRDLPAGVLAPIDGELRWYFDGPALSAYRAALGDEP